MGVTAGACAPGGCAAAQSRQRMPCTTPSTTRAWQPSTGTCGVQMPIAAIGWPERSRSRSAGVGAAGHSPSHSPLSAQTWPSSRVGTRQMGAGKIPASPAAPSQRLVTTARATRRTVFRKRKEALAEAE